MLTRLAIKGFKNLVDAEVRFGPLTCIAGANGIGKSNLFDAIQFLGLLADKSFIEAASEVRGGGTLTNLFTIGGDNRMHLSCDVLIPEQGVDDFNQPAVAQNTFVTYEIELFLTDDRSTSIPKISLEREVLSYVTKAETRQRLGFPHAKEWRDSVARGTGRRSSRTFIRTEADANTGDTVIHLQSDRMRAADKDRRGGGRPAAFLASRLPRTVLSSAHNAEEARTAVLLRREMRQWRQLQLEPSALRRSDDFQSPARIDPSGAHVPASLYRLATMAEEQPADVYQQIANRVAQLVEGVRSIRVDRDEGRKLLQLLLQENGQIELPASALSDGTLRFLALAVMERDPEETGVLCLEEPENGIHPRRIEAMLGLLEDMAVDPMIAVDESNPLRQVIFSTHSPLVVGSLRPEHVVFAQPDRRKLDGKMSESVGFSAVGDSWRTKVGAEPVSLGFILSYLGQPAPVAGDRGAGIQKPDNVRAMAERQLALFDRQQDCDTGS